MISETTIYFAVESTNQTGPLTAKTEPLKLDEGSHSHDSHGTVELKGEYFLGVTPEKYVKPDMTHPKHSQLEENIKKWWMSHRNPGDEPAHLSKLVKTSYALAAHIKPDPDMDMKSEPLIAFQYLTTNWFIMDDILDRTIPLNGKVSF